MINKEQFLQAAALPRSVITVDGIGDVEIVALSLTARADLMALTKSESGADIGRLVMRSCVAVLADATDDELDALDPEIVGKISKEVYDLSGLGDEDAQKN